MALKLLDAIRKYGFIVPAAVILVTLAIRTAEPVKDGDMFWHIAYGKYMVENKTLIPDHTIHSWTPATNEIIYCAWISEILLYIFHAIGGLSLLFVVKYLCVLLVLTMIMVYAIKLQQGRQVFTFFILLAVLTLNYGATFIKPELFSMVFIAIVPGLYFSIKSSMWGKWNQKAFFLYPIIFLIWTNAHGVFVFGLIMLALLTAGEILNYWLSPSQSIGKDALGSMVVAAIASVLVTVITPYGINYHVSLYESYIVPSDTLRITTVSAWLSPFLPQASHLGYRTNLPVVIGIFALYYIIFAWKKRSWDWAVFLANVGFAWISTRAIRTVFYWPALWAFSMLYLQYAIRPVWYRLPRTNMILKGLVGSVIVVFCFNTCYSAIYNPMPTRYVGFGIGYLNPVQASAFLKKHRPGNRIYNSYDIGGYLIHDLYPVYKVFCDPRAFPYADWYGEYWDFNTKEQPTLEAFNQKYPFDVAMVDYRTSESPILKFLKSADWEPVFYGPVAAVFVRKDTGFKFDFKSSDKHRFDGMKNLSSTELVFNTAVSLGDYDTARHILENVKQRFTRKTDGYDRYVAHSQLVLDGLAAYDKKDYEKALELLSKSEVITTRINLVLTQLRNWKSKQLLQKGEFKEALKLLEKTLQLRPNYADGLYHAGIIAYLIAKMQASESSPDNPQGEDNADSPLSDTSPDQDLSVIFQQDSGEIWQTYMLKFLAVAPDHKYAWVAKQLLKNQGLPSPIPMTF